MIYLDTSVVVRYLVGSPPEQARRAGALVDGPDDLGPPLVTVIETAHVPRRVYRAANTAIVDALIELVRREDVRLLDLPADDLVRSLTEVRVSPGRPIPSPARAGRAPRRRPRECRTSAPHPDHRPLIEPHCDARPRAFRATLDGPKGPLRHDDRPGRMVQTNLLSLVRTKKRVGPWKDGSRVRDSHGRTRHRHLCRRLRFPEHRRRAPRPPRGAREALNPASSRE